MWVWWTVEFDRIYKGYIKEKKTSKKTPSSSRGSRTTKTRNNRTRTRTRTRD